MSDTIEKVNSLGKLFGWVKGLITGVLGLCGGAVIMYVSPLVDKVVKPAKPLANFGVEVEGLKATFVNRAEGNQGWWDFGDGSPLEPFTPEQKSLAHEYRKAGEYTAKLTLSNLFGEESAREVNVRVEAGAGTIRPVAIDAFELEAVNPQSYAPATYKITTKISNSDLCVWACGGEHPLDVVTDPPAAGERYVTYKKPGQYIIKLAAVQGKQIVERSATVVVQASPYPTVLASVKVLSQAVRVKTGDKQLFPVIPLPPTVQGDLFRFSREVAAEKDQQVIGAKFGKPDLPPYIQNVKLLPGADPNKVLIVGEYVPSRADFAKKGMNPQWVADVLLTQQHKSGPINRTDGPVIAHLTIPGTTMIPLPKTFPGWTIDKRQVQLELLDNSQIIWNGPGLPKNSFLMLQNRPCQVTVTDMGGFLRVDILATKNQVSGGSFFNY